MIQYLRYPYKIWMASVVGGSILFLLWIYVFESSTNTGPNDFYPLALLLAMLVSALLSIPALLILWIAYWITSKNSLSKVQTKITLMILSLLLTIITARMIPSVDHIDVSSRENLEVVVCYSIAAISGIVLFPVSPIHTKKL